MAKLEIGVYDTFRGFEMDASPTVAAVYDQHIREIQTAEELGYRYYFVI